VTAHWAIVVGWAFVGLGVASALVIAVDELALGHRQPMRIMEVVHPVTALYLGPVWVWAYFTHGRRSSRKVLRRDAERLAKEDVDPDSLRQDGESTGARAVSRWNVVDAVSHCGAGCTLGDIVGGSIVFALGWTIAGATVWPEIALDLPLAWALGIAFQYLTIVPMRDDVGADRGLWLAIRADTLSILAFQVGLFAWMIFSATVLWQPALAIDTPTHWWMMQVGMILGFFTAYPVNRMLVRRGWKEKMDHGGRLAEMVSRRRDELAGPRDRRRRRPTPLDRPAAR
jgi:Domain of unknown function (DUF4396)